MTSVSRNLIPQTESITLKTNNVPKNLSEINTIISHNNVVTVINEAVISGMKNSEKNSEKVVTKSDTATTTVKKTNSNAKNGKKQTKKPVDDPIGKCFKTIYFF